LALKDIDASWQVYFKKEFQLPYMKALSAFLKQEKSAKKIIYPSTENIFKAFEYTPLDKVKVVIIGQDPYHGRQQAHGLCFSVPSQVPIPPSLMNIYQELFEDLGILPAKHGCLVPWAKQGVLLLNSVLTVEQGLAASHSQKGWELFTDNIIAIINKQPQPIAFVLWGAYAQQKGKNIDARHLVIRSAHPSPLSVYRGFRGSRPFSKINVYLQEKGVLPIDWRLDSV
jgi:uracil-DNA glycosylase